MVGWGQAFCWDECFLEDRASFYVLENDEEGPELVFSASEGLLWVYLI